MHAHMEDDTTTTHDGLAASERSGAFFPVSACGHLWGTILCGFFVATVSRVIWSPYKGLAGLVSVRWVARVGCRRDEWRWVVNSCALRGVVSRRAAAFAACREESARAPVTSVESSRGGSVVFLHFSGVCGPDWFCNTVPAREGWRRACSRCKVKGWQRVSGVHPSLPGAVWRPALPPRQPSPTAENGSQPMACKSVAPVTLLNQSRATNPPNCGGCDEVVDAFRSRTSRASTRAGRNRTRGTCTHTVTRECQHRGQRDERKREGQYRS